ncbi:MAG: class I SAM-dependent methyltransferase [Xanthobacteraceae bacterium]
MSEFIAFAEAERVGWADSVRAASYVDLFATASDQVIEPLLDAAGAKSGQRVLDLCCGQGNVAEALARRGCKVIGVDFSPTMLQLARQRLPHSTFIEADAQELPFRHGAFDVVVSNFGVCHVPDQRRALVEARRVLRQGGGFGMTVWCGPALSPSYELVYRAIKVHGAPDITPPPGPDFHQFADRKIASELLSDAGFSGIDMSVFESGWTLSTPNGLFDIFARGTVRAAMLLERQPPQHLAAIRSSLSDEVRRRFAKGLQWRVPTFATVISATT